MTNLSKFRDDLRRLIELGRLMEADLAIRPVEDELRRRKLSVKTPHQAQGDQQSSEAADAATKKGVAKVRGAFEQEYQAWYTEALIVVRQLLPDRLNEFSRLYEGDSRRREFNALTFTIHDWLVGLRAGTNPYSGEQAFYDLGAISGRFQAQLAIVRSIERRLESSLCDMELIIRAELFDSELDASRELLRHGFLRASGVMAGVVLERHLRHVAESRKCSTHKKKPTISDFNDALKATGAIDVPTWRGIQRLGDIRNLCAHDDTREPTKAEVDELIAGSDKISKTVH